jgi:hypothetical protein
MAFRTIGRTDSGLEVQSYNIDESIGAGALGNRRSDVALAQVLFKILYFEIPDSPYTPPAGHASIAVDGYVGRDTRTFILHWQSSAKEDGYDILLDGIFDPFRGQTERSKIAHVRYALELLGMACSQECRKRGMDNFRNLPQRTDLVPALATELRLPPRTVAHKYGRG